MRQTIWQVLVRIPGKIIFINEGFEVECIMKGLGEYSEIQSIFAEHVKSAE